MNDKKHLPYQCIWIWETDAGYSKELGQPTDLVYNTKTGIVYYFINGTLCPYYGKNGKCCTIKNMQIVEVC